MVEKPITEAVQSDHKKPVTNPSNPSIKNDKKNGDPSNKTESSSSSKQKRKKEKKKKKSGKKKSNNLIIHDYKRDRPEEISNVEIEYVQESLVEFQRYDPYYEFNKIFDRFKIETLTEETDPAIVGKSGSDKLGLDSGVIKKSDVVPIKARGLLNADDDDDDDDDDGNKQGGNNNKDGEKTRMSKKKLKKLNRLSVAELKQLVTRPDVVEMHDVTSRDPKLLVSLKSTRNTVPVPRHWCFKRKYLQGKRGIEKPAFDLPDFIKATGIMEMRQALAEKEDQKTLKSKMRERVRPKMGKIDIDYQKLHDAFFKWQTKPKMTLHGDLYYEGKEFETRLKEKKPGNLSDELKTALGMPIGPNSELYPPPWLIAVQRYGPPPSYPNLKIPGLNAPIPEGCSFGYHAGGWGKPPVDETGKPLYGDVFGHATVPDFSATREKEEEMDKSLWGELESESEEEDEEESGDEADKNAADQLDQTGLVTPGETGLVTPSGTASIPVGMETPESIELRKKRIEDSMDQGGDTPALYQILPEKRVGLGLGAAMMGSTHVYDLAGAAAAASAKKTGLLPGLGIGAEGIEVVLNPEELDLDAVAMKAKYEQTLREQQSQLEKEDLSDMVAEHQARQQKKRKKQQQQSQQQQSDGASSANKSKKMKEFKF